LLLIFLDFFQRLICSLKNTCKAFHFKPSAIFQKPLNLPFLWPFTGKQAKIRLDIRGKKNYTKLMIFDIL